MLNKDDFLQDLNDFINASEREMLGIDESDEHLINDKNQANYFVKLSKECQEEIEQIELLAEAEKERLCYLIDEFKKNEIQAISRRKEYYDRALEDFAHRELDGSNKRSMKLPYGSIGLKKQQPHWDYQDEAVLEWAKEAFPEFVKTTIPEPKISIDKKELKKQAEIRNGVVYLYGQEVPGIEVTYKDDKFEVK